MEKKGSRKTEGFFLAKSSVFTYMCFRDLAAPKYHSSKCDILLVLESLFHKVDEAGSCLSDSEK